MIDFPTSATFAALAADPRFPLAVGIATLSGAVRGFTGFGSALIYIPLIGAVYSPRIAAVTLLLIDFAGAMWPAIQARRECDWGNVVPIAIAAGIAAPFGAMLLLIVAPTTIRWAVSIMVLALLALLISGWRYHGRPHLAVKLGIGAFSGLSQGATQIGGPPLIVYWLSTSPPVTVRANLMVYFQLVGVVFIATYIVGGVFDANGLALSLLLAPPFFLTIGIGAYFFRSASDVHYRRIAYVIVAAAALISLPVFDGLLR